MISIRPVTVGAIASVVVVVSACFSNDDPTAPASTAARQPSASVDRAASPMAYDLTGQWAYVEEATVTFQSPGTGTRTTRCSGLAEGTYEFTQMAGALEGTFVQTGHCTFSDGTVVENPVPGGSISAGLVRNGAVSFDQPGCNYHGTVSQDGGSISGNVVCKYGKEVKYIGKWVAVRI